ncbi:MAG: fibrobacter succinogenes major paralogous domain-containing protein [Fibrobacter sp.]|nr:fibrobacter succinogenes major paralogous domain-containing protein [Fibrobacter sp.]
MAFFYVNAFTGEEDVSFEILKDDRDGQAYRIVTLGKQKWFAENLQFKVDGSSCYEGKSKNCKNFGRLYTWHSAQNACPDGWRLPTIDDFMKLYRFVGDKESAGSSLKSSEGWDEDGNGMDEVGFSVRPAGYCKENGSCVNLGYAANFWTSDEESPEAAWYHWFSSENTGASQNFKPKTQSRSIRCIYDPSLANNGSARRTASRTAEYVQAEAPTNTDVLIVEDSRDGQFYKTVQIGSQTWMAENLRYVTKEGSGCYKDNQDLCESHGRLYTWAAAMGFSSNTNANSAKGMVKKVHRGICPVGWHVPTLDEYKILFSTVGSEENAGRLLKSSFGWYDGGNGIDAVGFSVLPAGYRSYSGESYSGGGAAFLWTATEADMLNAYSMEFQYDIKRVKVEDFSKNYERSLRCVKD